MRPPYSVRKRKRMKLNDYWIWPVSGQSVVSRRAKIVSRFRPASAVTGHFGHFRHNDQSRHSGRKYNLTPAMCLSCKDWEGGYIWEGQASKQETRDRQETSKQARDKRASDKQARDKRRASDKQARDKQAKTSKQETSDKQARDK